MDNGSDNYRRYLGGDENAFTAIVEEYRDGLIFFINRFLQDPATAEDIAIDVFAELIVHPRRYDFRASLKTYLYTMGRSRALNHLKHRRRFPEVELSESIAVSQEPDSVLLTDERQRVISTAMDQLSPDKRTVLHLIYFEDMSYEQAARVMKKNIKQIDNLLYRAKSELRSIIGKDGVELL